MTRAYIRLDPAFDERKYDYPDGAYAALIAVLCLAEHQPERGRFRSTEYLGRLLGRRGRWVKYLIEHGDIVTQADGRPYVEGWDEWQEGDWKVNERVQRIRSRSKVASVTPDVTVDVTVDRQKRSGAEQSAGADGLSAAGLPNLTADAIHALEDRTGEPWSRAGAKQLGEYDRLVGKFGIAKVLSTFDGIARGQRLTARQLVWPAMKTLEPLPDQRAIAAAERQDEDSRNLARRLEATRQRNAAERAAIEARQGNPPESAA